MNVYNAYQPPASDGGYLKLKGGESAKVRIASEPYIFNSAYTDPITQETNVSTKYAWVVFNKDAAEAQVLQLPVTGYRAIAAIAGDLDWGDPTTYDIKVSREGDKLQTKWLMTPSPNKDPLTATQLEEVVKIDILKMVKGAIPLAQVVDGAPVPSPKVPSTPTDDNQPPIESYE